MGSDVASLTLLQFTAPDNVLYHASTWRSIVSIDYDFACILHPSHECGVIWDVTGVWEDELEILDKLRTRTIKVIKNVADVDAILCSILWRVTNSEVLRL
ncbi:hypothetical protein CC78DRAFT_579801 [Lojkania enalia]|uniref:Aminoglycoside phosphotransferase domain-containing protein n=1 Tax=Lojkania enalia TaxID=147567 RepID=A0A9P4N0N2_9PLEO|nr:hypothetical protein CC78DRAFT_579801 [Didymosphaeria enalia]